MPRLALLLFCFSGASSFWQTKNGNQLSKPAEYLGRYSQIGNRGTDLLRPISLTSTVGMEQAAIDFSDGTNLRLSSQFELKGNDRDAYNLIGKLIGRARRTVEAPFLQNPSGLEVSRTKIQQLVLILF